MINLKLELLNKFDINPIICGDALLDSEWEKYNVKSPFSRLYYIKRGSSYLYSKDKKVKMTEGNVYFIPAGTEFSYKCEQGDILEKRFFHISTSSYEYYDLLLNFSGIYSLPIKSTDSEEIFDITYEKNYLFLLEMKCIVYKTLSAFFRQFDFDSLLIHEYSPTVKKAIDYIQNNPVNNLTLENISKELFVSGCTLRKKFKDETGITIGQYIDNVTFYRAKQLLTLSNLSIREISENLGFSDQFYFSRRFKQLTGSTPSRYKKNFELAWLH